MRSSFNQPSSPQVPPWLTMKTIIISAIIFVLTIFLVHMSFHLTFTVNSGHYVIKQAAISGSLTAHMQPGMQSLWYGTIHEWPVSETYDFTAPDGRIRGDVLDDSVEVRFNDGATCHIGGTMRVDLPRSEKEALSLISEHGFKNWVELEDKLLTPVTRRALIMAANMMSSKESYSDRRQEFFQIAWDQIENGVYLTKDEQYIDIDPISSKEINRTRKIKLIDPKTGQSQRDKNPLEGLGIRLSNFEIKTFRYEDKVTAQITAQQTAIMEVQTAKANAQKAQQEEMTVIAQGKADVQKSKYAQEVIAAKAVVIAEQEAKIALTQGQKLVDVAELNKKAAAIELEIATLQKQSVIEKATGESEARAMILAADGALDKKLEAYIAVNKAFADAFASAPVPGVMMGGSAAAGTGLGRVGETNSVMDLIGIKMAKDLALDMSMTKQAPVVPTPAIKK